MAKSLWEDITYVQELLQHEMTNRQQHRTGSQEPAMRIMLLQLSCLEHAGPLKFHKQIYLIFPTYFHIYFLFFVN